MKVLNNERGSILYVLMISMVLIIFIPGLLMLSSNTQLSERKNLDVKKATQLAVSGMQAFTKNLTTSAKIAYLNNYSGARSISSPEGGTVYFHQYLVNHGTSTAVSLPIVDEHAHYDVIIEAISGDTNNNQIKNTGENYFYSKRLVREFDLRYTDMAFLSYSFIGVSGSTSTVDATNRTVLVHVPYGTSLTNLTAVFTLSDGASAKIGTVDQISGLTANNFTTPAAYVVTAANASSNNWTVTVIVDAAPLPSAKDITAYSFTSPAVVGTIDSINRTVQLQVPYGTNLNSLIAAFTLSNGATAKVGTTTQISGSTANNFTSSPISYLITAADATTNIWEVYVTVQSPTSLKAITAFSFPEQTSPATIDATNRTIVIEVNSTANLTSLTAAFSLSANATAKVGTVPQTSGTTANNFATSTTTPFNYTVTAQDGSTNNWTVVVTQVGGSGNDGIVWVVDDSGIRVPEPFSPIISTTGATQLVISSSVAINTTSTEYNFSAPAGIVIEPGVDLSTTSGGNTDITLTSTSGNISISGVSLTSTGSSSHSEINIVAAGNVNISGAVIEAQKDIFITAGGNILATNATINKLQDPGAIIFTINNPTLNGADGLPKIFTVSGVNLNKPATAGTSGIKICGNLALGSSSLNGFTGFTGGYCPP